MRSGPGLRTGYCIRWTNERAQSGGSYSEIPSRRRTRHTEGYESSTEYDLSERASQERIKHFCGTGGRLGRWNIGLTRLKSYDEVRKRNCVIVHRSATREDAVVMGWDVDIKVDGS